MISKIDEIIDQIDQNETAVFVGAGISFNSGLPLANMLKQAILEKLTHNSNTIKEIMDIDIPFELFIENLSHKIDLKPILELFREGKPNTNHFLIAKLAKFGMVKTILTTNFDILIEKALISNDVPFHVFSTFEDFNRINSTELKNQVKIIKLHGSADNLGNIKTTLKSVANSIISTKISDIIRYVFSMGSHHQVLIFGYSCSDLFDISPIIEEITEDQKLILFIEHLNIGHDDVKIEEIWSKRLKNPFKKYSGKRIIINTNHFCRKLWESNIKVFGAYIYRTSKLDWKSFIDWDHSFMEDFIDYEILGSIYLELSQPNKAITYFEKGSKTDKGMGQIYCTIGLAHAYGRLGDHNKVIANLNIALNLAEAWQDPMAKIICYNGLGNAYISLGNLTEASININKAAGISEQDPLLFQLYHDIIQLSLSRIELKKNPISISPTGMINTEINPITEKSEITHLREGLEQCIQTGNLKNVLYHLDMIGELLLRQKDYINAKKQFSLGLDLAKKIGDRENITIFSNSLGTLSFRNNEFSDGIDYFLQGKEFAEQIGNSSLILCAIVGLGDCFHEFNKKDDSIFYYKEGLKIAKEMNNKKRMVDCYLGLGNVYKKLNDRSIAEEYYKEGLKIAESIGDKLGQSAIEYVMKQLDHFNSEGVLKDIKKSRINQYDQEIVNLLLDKLSKGKEKSINIDKIYSIIHIGIEFYDNKDYQKSMTQFSKVIELDSQFKSFEELNAYVIKKANLNESITLTIDVRLALLYLGLIHEKTGNHKLAEDCILNASYSCYDPLIRILAGQFYLECGEPDFRLSIGTFMTACRSDPNLLPKCDELFERFLKEAYGVWGYLELPHVIKRWNEFKNELSF